LRPSQASLPSTVVKFVEGGTGFLVSVCDSINILKYKLLGLVITAAHVLCDYKIFDPKVRCFKRKIQNNFVRHISLQFMLNHTQMKSNLLH
jgi:hypothetical protein